MPPKRKRRGSAGGNGVALPPSPGLRSDLECTVCGGAPPHHPFAPHFFVNNDEALTPLEPDRIPATMSCSGCGGFYYCGREHQEMHWSDLDHNESCERTKKQVART